MYNQSWLHQYATLIKWWKVNRAKQSAVEKMGSSLSKKIWRSSNFYTFVGLSSTTSRLNGEYLQNEDDTDNRVKCVGTTRGLLHHLKIWWTLVHKQRIMGPEFFPPSVISAFYFIAKSRTRNSANGKQTYKRNDVNVADASWIRWHCIVNVNETIKIRSLVSQGPKGF